MVNPIFLNYFLNFDAIIYFHTAMIEAVSREKKPRMAVCSREVATLFDVFPLQVLHVYSSCRVHVLCGSILHIQAIQDQSVSELG